MLPPKILALLRLSSWTRFSLASSFFSWKYNVIPATFLILRYVRGLYIYFKACFLKFDREKRFSLFLSEYNVIPATFATAFYYSANNISNHNSALWIRWKSEVVSVSLSSVCKTIIVVIWRIFSCAPEVNLRAPEDDLRSFFSSNY